MTALKIAIQMDPVASLNFLTDTTFALAVEAEARGHRLFCFAPHQLAWDEGHVHATAQPFSARYREADYFTLGEPRKLMLDDMDIILMRQEPPFDMSYITACYLLEQVGRHVLAVNDPHHVRLCGDKLYAGEFRDLMPPTLITADLAAISAFRAAHQDIIIKPLYGHGGSGVFRLRPEDENLLSLHELFMRAQRREPVMVQRYLPEIQDGERRILLLDGEAAGVYTRHPAENMVRTSIRRAGSVTDADRKIAARVAPFLRERGILIAGLDVIGGYLTEINITCPAGIKVIRNLGGTDLGPAFWALAERKLAERRGDLAAGGAPR